MAKKHQIVSFGEALIDFTPSADDTYAPNVGGAPFNLAVCGAKYGCRVAFIGKVGNDAFGKLIVCTAEKFGVDTTGILWDSQRVTTHAFVTLDKNGDRDFVFCREHGADTAITASEIPMDMVEDTELFHFGGLSLTDDGLKEACLAAVDHAANGGAIISFDPNYRALLWKTPMDFVNECNAVLSKVDILKVSLEEALMLTKKQSEDEAVVSLAEKVPALLLTKGADGAVWIKGKERVILPPVKAMTVDTTGAGDIFFGVFLSAMLMGGYTPRTLDRERAAAFGKAACYYAAKSTEKHGAIPSIPNFSQENWR